MLPFGRGALLAKSASFKKIPEDIQIKHEIYAKNRSRFLGDLFFGSSAGHPWDRFWPPQGHPWNNCGLPLGALAAMFHTFPMNLGIIWPEMSTISERHSHTS